MNLAALIIWFNAAGGRLLFRAARLIEHTSGLSACRRHLPACISDLRRACTTLADPAARCGPGVLR